MASHECDGCGKVAPWGPGWRTFGTIHEEENGIVRWKACSDECAALMPSALGKYKTTPYGGPYCPQIPEYQRRLIESMRNEAKAKAGGTHG